MKHPKFEFYTRPNGRTEFIEFLQTLPTKDKQKLLATINMIQEQVTFNVLYIFILLMTVLSSRMVLPRKYKRPLLLKSSTLRH